jgi:hypothetical protein
MGNLLRRNTILHIPFSAPVERGPNKRRVKPVPHHKMMIHFAGLGDSSDDSDFEIGKKKGAKKKAAAAASSSDSDSGSDDDDDDDDDDSDEDEDEDEDEDGSSAAAEEEEGEEDKSEKGKDEAEEEQKEKPKPSIAEYLERTKERLTQCENSKVREKHSYFNNFPKDSSWAIFLHTSVFGYPAVCVTGKHSITTCTVAALLFQGAASEDTAVSSVSSRPPQPLRVAICCICLGDIR